jgi:hypothetical protein
METAGGDWKTQLPTPCDMSMAQIDVLLAQRIRNARLEKLEIYNAEVGNLQRDLQTTWEIYNEQHCKNTTN